MNTKLLKSDLLIKAIFSVYILLNISCHRTLNDAKITDDTVEIFPDYKNIIIPPNIAPLNFYIQKEGKEYAAVFRNKKKQYFTIFSKSSKILISETKWKSFISDNIGDTIYIDVFVRDNENIWKRFLPIINYISVDSLDEYVVYRIINTGHVLWNEMGIYQRQVSSFKEKPIITNNLISRDCINCHTFSKQSGSSMLFHVRGENKGTILCINNKIVKLNTSTPYTMSAAVYPSWHPGGKIIAFSVNRINQSFQNYSSELIEVYDKASDLILYHIDKNEITTAPQISTYGNETYPCWSPDGNYLYYCLAPRWSETIPVDSFRYSLMRISYDSNTNTWGVPEKLIDAEKVKKSITFPRVSPDGKLVLICMSNHGGFSIFYPSSDLYVYNVETKNLYPLDAANSSHVDSYHSWSSNGRWIVFSSKRLNSLHARPFITYFNDEGKASKAFVLPTKDPHFYETFLSNYNVPELIKTPISVNMIQLANAIQDKALPVLFDKKVDIDALSGATKIIR